MTDKQIIIDGCDVSGCDCYYDGKCLCEYNEINRKIIRYYSCNKFPNCYYKNWQRKEQECEAYKMEADEGKEINAELKAENKHLNDLLNQALKELEAIQDAYEERE